MRLRPSAVAGRFYPADPEEPRDLVDRLLGEVPGHTQPVTPAVVVAPHAGYQYSGAVAATAYAQVAGSPDVVRRVVLLGPAHFWPLDGMAVPAVDAFATPLGVVGVDDDARTAATALPGVAVDDRPHAGEHSLETQLPFLQRVLGPEVTVLPVLAGRSQPEYTAAALVTIPNAMSTSGAAETAERHAHGRPQPSAAVVVLPSSPADPAADRCGLRFVSSGRDRPAFGEGCPSDQSWSRALTGSSVRRLYHGGPAPAPQRSRTHGRCTGSEARYDRKSR